ncbi:Hypothetical protein SRAE_1000049300 [Strongyloides ratti]|uniref:Uncharacterized protein n=1 Tax=Strongyloides ratti TaxID=34506 RepID=A0A090KXL5_STRRB|nr:Hypothetical protein SRAE_1000049300 [Strongyloides ratti]CEF62220.1 Hypothetical protein SRAE_1000049300 [Strongyloides ratti]
MSLEGGTFYNIVMLTLSIIALVFNSLDFLVNFSNKLYKQSLYNCLKLYSNVCAIILSIRNIVVSFANLCILNDDWFFTSKDVCLGRAITDNIIVTLYQVAFVFEIIVFGLSVVHPVFFMKHIDNKTSKICIGFFIIFISIFIGCMMLIGRGNLPQYLGFCVIYNNWTLNFQEAHSSFTLAALILVIIIYIRTARQIGRMSSEEKFKKNLCSFMCWSMFFFMIFGILPNTLLVVSFFMNFDCNFRNVCLDTFYLTICISLIVPFPFALWKNKLIRKHFLELPFVPKVIYRTSITKTSNIIT